MESTHVEVAVLGGGPGGYAAAFYAADKNKSVALIEQDPQLGGACLHRGCIPSKALLHATALMREALTQSPLRGIVFGQPSLDLAKLRSWKTAMLNQLAQGLSDLARGRRVSVVQGKGCFEDSRTLRVDSKESSRRITYDKAIIAVGSRAVVPSGFDLCEGRVMTSTEALMLDEIPQNLLVIGGGYIGLELGSVYATLGSRVVVVEAMETILAGVDADMVRVVSRSAERLFSAVRLGTRVLEVSPQGSQVKVILETQGQRSQECYDRVLLAVGRAASGDEIGLERTHVKRDDRGFIMVDSNQRTSNPDIYAIGDVTGGMLLAHKATHEAKVAIEAILGNAAMGKDTVIPAVVYTDPEVAWCGMTEAQARAQGCRVKITRLPWAASGRATSLDRTEGLTKLIVDTQTERLLGVGIVGMGAGELIGEGILAVQMGLSARDLAHTVHPHPTLSETLKECAELYYGSSTHMITRHR